MYITTAKNILHLTLDCLFFAVIKIKTIMKSQNLKNIYTYDSINRNYTQNFQIQHLYYKFIISNLQSI